MKQIIISLLLYSSAMMAMEQQNAASQRDSGPLYAGIVTHVLGSIYEKDVLHIIPCEEDIVVYEYDRAAGNFEYVDRFTKSYLEPQSANVIQTMPDFSSLKHRICKTSLDALTATIDFKTTWVSSVGAYYERKLGFSESPAHFSLPIPLGQAALVSEYMSRSDIADYVYKAHFDYNMFAPNPYRPGATFMNGNSSQFKDIKYLESWYQTSSHKVTQLLKKPGSNALAMVIAFLSLKKHSETMYIPSPSNAALTAAFESAHPFAHLPSDVSTLFAEEKKKEKKNATQTPEYTPAFYQDLE